MRKKISLKKKRISKKEIRDYYNITATDNVRSLKHLRKKKPVVNAVVEPVIEINPDPDEVDYKKLLENKIKECQDCKNKDTKIEAGRFSKPAVLQENRHLSNMRWKQILMKRADLDT